MAIFNSYVKLPEGKQWVGIERDGTRHLASAFLDTFVHIHIVDRIALKNTQRSDVMYGSPDRFGMLHLL